MNWRRRRPPEPAEAGETGVCLACREPGAPLDAGRPIHPRCTAQIIATVARESRPGWKAA